MSGKLVLVTGASGYIGAHVTKKLQEAGYRVRGTVRSLKNEKKVNFLYNLAPGANHQVELVEADLLKVDSWPAAVSGCDFVMHTASPFPGAAPKNENEIIKPAVEGTLNVLRAASETGTVKKIVLTSSFAAIQGRGPEKSGPFTEKDWSVPEKQQAYMKSKTLAEKAAWDFLRDLPHGKKFDLSVINPVLVMGPALHDNVGTSMGLLIQLLERKMSSIPQFYIPCVDVRDVAEAHLRALTNQDSVGNRHLLFSDTAFFPDIGKWLSEEFKDQGYNVPTGTVPNFIIRIASFFSADVKAMREFGKDRLDISNERLRTVLGIKPIEARKSIIDMAYSLIELGVVRKTDKYTGPNSK